MKLYDYIEGRGYWQLNLPLVQVIKSECTMTKPTVEANDNL